MAVTKPIKKSIPDELFNILACPIDKADLKYDKEKNVLICTKCNKVYEIKDDIPNMII